MPSLKKVRIAFKIPGVAEIDGEWKPDRAEKEAAWELYVELSTRIALVGLDSEEGVLREALNSVYSLFGTTRTVLKKYGPSVGTSKGGGSLSLGYISVAMLNGALRPFLVKWHRELLEHESHRADGVSLTEHERQWEKVEDLRNELAALREVLRDYGDVLATIADVDPLIPDEAATL